MLVNSTIHKTIEKALSTALYVVDSCTNFNVKAIIPGKKNTEIIIGKDRAMRGGGADFNHSSVYAAIQKAMKKPAFPTNVRYKKTAKGHQLYIHIEKIKEDGNHNNNID